ncbi:methyl-accepting chemotaxis protein [Desulfonauticus submarinus]|uniref:Methyl-accepting chemotaxis protein n=1 Tax=Desulfonauticus submarinus TaxID=206665 RepID=A0A1G9ZXB2_9BACT|nr:methyl-accepting chemotaxis protein [Desulfonauticus submarinus]SDN25960.1 methyl-accepting chemotaxis protein [Desulfonauticus submarinus]
MKVRMLYKLLVAFLLTSLVFVGVSFYVLQNIHKLNIKADNIISIQKKLDILAEVKIFLNKSYATVDNIYFKKKNLISLLNFFNKDILVKLKLEQDKKFKQIKDYLDIYVKNINKIANIERRGGLDYIRAKSSLKSSKLQLLNIVEKYKKELYNKKYANVQAFKNIQNESKLFSVYGMLFGVLFALVLGSAVAIYESGRIKKCLDFVHKLGRGDFETSINIRGSDEIHALVEEIKKVQKRLSFIKEEILAQKDAISVGNILFRSDVSKYEGGFKEILEAVNKLTTIFTEHLNNAPIPLMSVDKDFRILFISKMGLNMIGKKLDEVVGKYCYDIFDTDDCKSGNCGCKQAMIEHAIKVSETTFKVDNKQVYVRYYGNPIIDEKGEVCGAFEYVLDITDIKETQLKLNQLAKQGEEVSSKLSRAAQELRDQIESTSSGSNVQKRRAEETAAAMEEMNSSVLEVSKNASLAAESADKAREIAEEGAKVVELSIKAILGVKDKADALAQNMSDLENRASDIGKIVNVITDIADQTNLLALNAAIEAARAGDAGRGFAVVADEVRKLAEKTMNATKEVEESILSIQDASKINVAAMKEMDEIVLTCTKHAKKAGEALESILEKSRISLEQVRMIAAASEEQSSVSEEITRSSEEISQISQETAKAMEKASKSISQLAGLAQELNGLIMEMTKI